MEDQFSDTLHFVKVDFLHHVVSTVIIFVRSVEIENTGDAALGEVVMVTAVVIAIGIIFGVVGIVQLQLGVLSVHSLVDVVKVCTQAITTNNVNVIWIISVFFIYPTHHIYVDVNDGIFQWPDGVIHVLLAA